MDVDQPAVREEFALLRIPEASSPERQNAAREASTDAFRLAMLVAALLCASGAAVNWVGIRDEDANEPR
jgi:hypothetical protein